MAMFDILTVKKTVQDLVSKARSLKDKIEELKKQREDIATAPAAKSDIKAQISREIEDRAAKYEKHFRRQMDRFVRAPARIADGGQLRQDLFLAITPENGQAASFLTAEMGMAAIFKKLMIDGLHAQVDAMEWPDQGLPAAERARSILELDDSIGRLERELSELLGSARSAGISIDV